MAGFDDLVIPKSWRGKTMRLRDIWAALVILLSIALLVALFNRRDALPAPVRGLLAILATGAFLLALWQLSAAL